MRPWISRTPRAALIAGERNPVLLAKMPARVDQLNRDIAEVEELVAPSPRRWSDWMTSPASDAPLHPHHRLEPAA
ncbi:hypothetical protein ACIBI9_59775 [Nonomuraea sp. NPDC050451]|uniref:hypothetical protein n=1 Tax=Nonomuraea sp. NPDC050451 TaxID=3364364 RepID=UPI0037B358F6